ncbi:MAG: anti-sigma factor antagonist [Ignavibacteriaceae bacterium]|nr:MAG: anti-sigma factor antagonist [Chlorobiota bacterium]GJQ31562.1 MAG: anti-sigma factor antagonist [Ignavibacteriaceae bacterium]
MNFKVEKIKDVVVVSVGLQRATLNEAEEFKKTLLAQIDAGASKLVIDLSASEFIDSTFLGALVVSLKKISQIRGDLRLVGFQPAVQSMFELTRMYRIFEAFKTKDDAVKSFQQAGNL